MEFQKGDMLVQKNTANVIAVIRQVNTDSLSVQFTGTGGGSDKWALLTPTALSAMMADGGWELIRSTSLHRSIIAWILNRIPSRKS